MAFQAEGALLLPAYVLLYFNLFVRPPISLSPSVRPSTLRSSHDDQSQVWAGNTNFAQTCNLGYSRLTLKIGIIELDYLIWLSYLQLYEIRLVRAITRLSCYRKYWSLTLTSKVILAIWPIIRGNVVCPRNRFYWVWTRITKFAANMHLEILLTGIEYRGHWHWPSRSFGQLVTGFPETAFNVAILCWSRPTKRCYTSQCALVFIVTIDRVDNCRWKLSPNLLQICILRFSWLVLNIEVIDNDLQGHLANSSQDSQKRRSMSLFYADLGRPSGVTRLNVLLFLLLLLMRLIIVVESYLSHLLFSVSQFLDHPVNKYQE